MLRILLVLMLIGLATASADDKPPKYPVETKTFELKLTDGDKPVANAEVQLYACRCEEDPGSHYGWPTNNTDVPVTFKSDEKGMVTLRYPVKFGEPANWKTISEISMKISHPSYVGDELHVNPNEGEATKELKSGCELTLSAVNETRDPIDIAVVMAGPGRTAKWTRNDEKVVSSRAIPDGRWQTLLVSPRDDGRHLFSGVLPVRLADSQDVTIRNLRLKPGLQILGQLSDNVVRPVKKGRVMAFCLPRPAGRTWGTDDPSVSWAATVDVNEDGSFEFPSLPTTGKIQFIAIADGWVTTEKEGNQHFRKGHIIEIDELEIEDDVCSDFVLDMEPTGTVVVTVVKPDGSPLKNANVSTNPNQVMELGGSTILGSFRDSVHLARGQITGEKIDYSSLRVNSQATVFMGVTDDEGQFTLKGIPVGVNYQVGAYHDDFILPPGDRGRRKRVSYQCDSAGPIEVTIKMEERTE